MNDKQPTYGNGKICYLEIPASDVEVSASFYNKALGWKLRRRDDGEISFDDGVGEVSGMWVVGRKPVKEPGIVISIMVDNAEETSKLITAHGGKILSSSEMDSGEVIVHFSDPAGNLMGLYQQSASIS
jgi:predicted enzyme related to lactoylglutathione lyase